MRQWWNQLRNARKPWVVAVAVGFSMGFSVGGVQAAANLAAMSPAKDPVIAPIDLKQMPQELINQVTRQVIEAFKARPASLSKDEVKRYNKTVVEKTIAPVVDFEVIAKRVMAASYKTASESQRTVFTALFRESLLSTYTDGMSAYSNQKVELDPFAGVQQQGGRERAVVSMKVYGADGKIYPAMYSLYKNDAVEWKLENLTLNGVNIGLTFRNQFSEILKQQKGSIDGVIANWNATAAGFE
jgi:phospholipid transport system substrate-binding protein